MVGDALDRDIGRRRFSIQALQHAIQHAGPYGFAQLLSRRRDEYAIGVEAGTTVITVLHDLFEFIEPEVRPRINDACQRQSEDRQFRVVAPVNSRRSTRSSDAR